MPYVDFVPWLSKRLSDNERPRKKEQNTKTDTYKGRLVVKIFMRQT